MKYFSKGIFPLIVALIVTGCATPLKMNKLSITEVPPNLAEKNTPDMEFIGFKADANSLSTENGDSVKLAGTWTMETYNFPSEFNLWKSYKNDTCLRNIGSVLQNANVAYDQSYAYFGIFSLQELELYKSKKRFVTFIEVNKHRLGGTVKDNFMMPGSIILGAGIGCALSGATWAGLDSNNELGLGNTGKTLVGVGIGSAALGAILLAIPEKTMLSFNAVYQIYIYDTQKKEIIYKDAITINLQFQAQ